MTSLAMTACIVGGVISVLNIPGVLAPAAFKKAMEAFPRSKWPGWILTLVCLVWVSWVVLHAHLGWFDILKPAIYLAAPVSFLLIIVFMDELLSPRALGGLLMLIANPVLTIARWHPSNWRLVMTVIAYLWVVAGITLMLTPFRFRQVSALVNGTVARCRLFALVRVFLGLVIIGLGLFVY